MSNSIFKKMANNDFLLKALEILKWDLDVLENLEF